jgi:hypothetical protein
MNVHQKAGPRRRAQPGVKFLWVNKTSASESLSNDRSNRSLSLDINRHAQKAARDRERRQKARISTATNLVGWKREPRDSDEKQRALKGWELVSRPDANDDIPTPRPVIDSTCNGMLKLDPYERIVLGYFEEASTVPGSAITPRYHFPGSLPIVDKYKGLSLQIIREAMQSQDLLSFYSLLASVARLMQGAGHATASLQLCEVYTLKAIQELRHFLESRRRASKRLVLDISYLMLAESRALSPVRSEIYSRLIRNTIVESGGFQYVHQFHLQSALANDILMGLSTMTLPTLDPFEDMALLGLQQKDGPTTGAKLSKLQERIGKLELLSRVLVNATHQLTQVLQVIQKLPDAFQHCVKFAQRPDRKILSVIYVSFAPSPNADHENSSASTASSADTLTTGLKFTGTFLWLWYYALSCSSASAEARWKLRPPVGLLTLMSPAWKIIDRIYDLMVDDKQWKMPDVVFLWLCSLGWILASNDGDRDEYQRLLVKLAAKLHVDSADKLQAVLGRMLSLEYVCEAAKPPETKWPDVVWEAIASVREEG